MHPATAWGRWCVQTFVATLNRVVLNEWVAKRIGDGGEDEEDIPLPEYEAFAGVKEKEGFAA